MGARFQSFQPKGEVRAKESSGLGHGGPGRRRSLWGLAWVNGPLSGMETLEECGELCRLEP